MKKCSVKGWLKIHFGRLLRVVPSLKTQNVLSMVDRFEPDIGFIEAH